MIHVLDIVGRVLVVLTILGAISFGVLWLLAKGMSQ
jgi:hypothetical protein